MRAYLLCSLLIVSVAAMGCGDGKPGTDARDGAGDGKGDGSASSDRADVGGDKPANGGNGGSTTGSAGTGGSTGGDAGTGGTGGTGGTAGSGGTSGNDGGAGADGGGNDSAAPTCNDGIKNSDETGIDCGGHCGKCAPGNPCLVNTDCQYACRADKTCASCNVAADCPGTESECEHRTCTAGACGSTREAAGTVLAVQSTGDCKRLQCAANGTVASVNDDADVPDDRNACTNDVCTTGAPSHTMLPESSNCGGANHCNATGQCIGCTVAADCPGSDTACRTRTCTTGGVCGYSFAALGTKLVDPTARDCKGLQCDGKGNDQVYNEDADLPIDGNVCTTDECSSGTPSHRPVASGTACGGSLVCDGASKCVECLSASTCPGTDAECHTRSCMSGACGVANMAMGTLVGAQTPRDCKKNVCNGQGGVTTVNDDLDLPVDSNACTFDVCTAGTPTNPNVTAGNSCGNNTICDGQGACVTCLTASSCPGTDTDCHHRTCTNGVCGVANMAAGTPLSMQMAGDCKRSQCDGSGGSMIVNDNSDKPVDGNACTTDVCTAGVPSNPNLATGTTCGTDLICNAQGACVGCITAANCGPDTTCQKRTCSAAGVCGVTNTAVGTLLPPEDQTAGDCKRVQCDGQGQSTTVNDDADKLVDGNACTKDLCNGGIATNPPEDSGTACSQGNGTKCNGSGSAPACVQCLQASECPGTDDECHHRTCTNGVCGSTNTNEGMTIPDATANCHKNVCTNGAVTPVVDNSDVLVDGNPCTDDKCNNGVVENPNITAGMTCGNNNQMCDGNGACVGCIADANCTAANACQVPVCMTGGVCGVTPRAPFIPVTDTAAGDCHTNECDGAGGIRSVVNTSDTPSANGNECMQGTCNGGAPDVIPQNSGFACTQDMGKKCDGAGKCVECLDASECPDTGNDCILRTCTLGVCGTSPAPLDTPVSVQVLGDCKDSVCDGFGFTKTIDNNGDAPAPTNQCVTPTCSAGNVTPTPKAHGTTCTVGGRTCNGSGVCGTTFSVLKLNGILSSGTSMTIEERKLDGTLVGTTDLPTAASGSNLGIVNSGSASSEGSLSLSGDGRYLIVAGYNADVGTAMVASAAGIPRIVGRIDAASPANVNTTTTISQTTAFTGNNVRGATSQDGTGFWVSGAGSGATDTPPNDGGVWWISLGGTMGPIQLSTVQTNTRWLHIIGGQLYGSSNNNPNANVFTIGTGLPTTSGAAIASLPGMPATGPSPFSFVLFDRNSDGTLETMYVSDDGNAANQGIQKWTFGTTLACPSTPCWTRVATHNFATHVDFKGLAGYMAADGSSVTLMATTDEANSRLVRIDEVFTPSPSVTVTQVGMSGTAAVFRGVALSPHL